MENYRELRCIGKGSFGEVWLVKDKRDKRKYVVKRQEFHLPKDQEQAAKEVGMLSNLRHPNIVGYREAFVKDRFIFMVMQYCDGGDLDGLIEAHRHASEYFAEGDMLHCFSQLCLAVDFLHQNKVLHRDLKPQNVFLTSNNMVRLGDFGVARTLESTMEMAQTFVGTPYYLSPELVRNEPYNSKSDMYSLGVILYELAMLRRPYEASDMPKLVTKIVTAEYDRVTHYSDELASLVDSLLARDPASRPSAADVLQQAIIQRRLRLFLTRVLHGVGTDSHGMPVGEACDADVIVKQVEEWDGGLCQQQQHTDVVTFPDRAARQRRREELERLRSDASRLHHSSPSPCGDPVDDLLEDEARVLDGQEDFEREVELFASAAGIASTHIPKLLSASAAFMHHWHIPRGDGMAGQKLPSRLPPIKDVPKLGAMAKLPPIDAKMQLGFMRAALPSSRSTSPACSGGNTADSNASAAGDMWSSSLSRVNSLEMTVPPVYDWSFDNTSEMCNWHTLVGSNRIEAPAAGSASNGMTVCRRPDAEQPDSKQLDSDGRLAAQWRRFTASL